MKRFAILLSALVLLSACSGAGHLGQNVTAVWMTLMRRLGFTTSPAAVVDLSTKHIARIGPETGDIEGIYFSDFVEKDNSNHIRPAALFRHSPDTLLGDRMMPLSHFSRFYGVEDGRIKAGRLDKFADSTLVLPVRNRDFGYISRIELDRAPSNRGWLYVRNPFRILKERRQLRLEMYPERPAPAWLRDQLPIVSYYPPDTGVRVFDVNGNEMEEPTVRMARNGKIFLADSLGHAVFINNLPGLETAMLDRLNALLAAHPMGPVLIDNGRYYSFSLEGGSYAGYVSQDLYHPDSCLFVVGSVLE